ncbi:MAG: hypothetical protein ACK58T_47205 [Phycisphaerae bacterium]
MVGSVSESGSVLGGIVARARVITAEIIGSVRLALTCRTAAANVVGVVGSNSAAALHFRT